MKTFDRLCMWIAILLAGATVCLGAPGAAVAIGIEPGERFHLRMVVPIENNAGFRVWGSKYYPGDVLAEKMTEHFYRRMKEIPRLQASKVRGSNPENWPVSGFSASDMVVRVTLEQFDYRKNDTISSKVQWDIVLHLYVYNAATRRLVYETVVREKDMRQYALYREVMESEPIYWDAFAQTPYWAAIRHALDDAFYEVVDGYNGYRIIGQIVAKAERVDGSLSVPKKKRDKLYHVNLGREDSVKAGDILVVTRASSVRTVTPEHPEMHFPQIVGRVRVVFIKGQDAVVEIVKESSEGPIQLGDAVSAPLYGRRDGKGF